MTFILCFLKIWSLAYESEKCLTTLTPEELNVHLQPRVQFNGRSIACASDVGILVWDFKTLLITRLVKIVCLEMQWAQDLKSNDFVIISWISRRKFLSQLLDCACNASVIPAAPSSPPGQLQDICLPCQSRAEGGALANLGTHGGRTHEYETTSRLSASVVVRINYALHDIALHAFASLK